MLVAGCDLGSPTVFSMPSPSSSRRFPVQPSQAAGLMTGSSWCVWHLVQGCLRSLLLLHALLDPHTPKPQHYIPDPSEMHCSS